MKKTIEEREFLMKPARAKHTGFTPRPVENLASKKPRRSMLNVECNHFLRCSSSDTGHGQDPVVYKMWMEAGKHPAPFPERPDQNYNSNVWRNFRQEYGFHTNTEGQNISEMIAAMYPLNIPQPSRLGDYHFSKFLRETAIIEDEKFKKMAIARTTADIADFRKNKLRSDARYPPISNSGEILPPANFKRYARKFIPPVSDTPQTVQEPPADTRVDIFGQEVPRARREPHFWKLAYKLNTPQYQDVLKAIEERKSQKGQRHHPPAINLVRTQ